MLFLVVKQQSDINKDLNLQFALFFVHCSSKSTKMSVGPRCW